MAYGVKYELFFSDIEKRKLKIEILEKDFTGDPSTIIGTGQPAVIEWDADDDIYSPIIGSRCKLSFFVTDLVQYDEFYRSDERQYKVKILYYNSYGNDLEEEPAIWNTMDVIWNGDIGEPVYYQPIWEGFLVVDRYQEAVLTPPYEINLEAIDGLGTLEGFNSPFNSSDTSNTDNLFYYLKEILKLTGHEFDIYIANGIRKATSPPEDETIFHDIVVNEYGLFNKNMTLRSAKDVLEQILQITNSRIFQSYARWYVISNSNLIHNTIDTAGVIDNIAPSDGDVTDAPNEPSPVPVYTQPSIGLSGQDPMYIGTGYFLTVTNSGTTAVSYEFTLPDASTVTQTSPNLSIGVVEAGNDGDTYSVTATDANGQTDSATFTLNVDARPVITNPDPPEDETVETNYTLKIDAASKSNVSGAYISPENGTINYAAGEVGDAFTMQFNVVSLTGEFTSVSQLTSAIISNNTGNYSVSTQLIAEFIRVTVTGSLPSGGGTEFLTLIGASEVQQFTTTFTKLGTVSNASVSTSPAGLSVTGGVGKEYTMTITFTASSGYEWTGLGNMQIVASDDIGQTITTSFTSSVFTVTITGEIGIADQAANITINGAPIFAQPATTITTNPSTQFDFSSGGGYFDVSVVSDGAFVIVTEKDYFQAVPSSGAAGTTLVRVYVDPNNTPNTRRGNLLFRPRASLTTLTTLTFDQESNLQAQ